MPRTLPWMPTAGPRRPVSRGVGGAPGTPRLAAVVVAVGLGAATLVVRAPDAGAATRALQVGVVGDITWGTSQADIDRTVTAMASAGIGWVRANVAWSGGEPDAKGVLNEGWHAQVDYAIRQARAAGLRVLMPISDGVPYWASADPAKFTDGTGRHWNKYWRPTKTADYADYVRAMVARYQPMGVHTYEVWNEPNTVTSWPSGPNAAEFTTLLAAAYPAVKAADPTATVVAGGLSKNDYDYLAQLYAAGAKPSFDAVAVHPYTGTVDPTSCWNQSGTAKRAKDAFCGIEEIRNTMVANGDAAKSIWITEFGWSTTTSTYGVTEATQADYLTKALDKVRSSYPYVATAFWYNFRNNFWLNNAPGDYEANHGLLRVDFSTKPSYAAMQTWARAGNAARATPLGVYRPSTAVWYLRTDPAVSQPWGASGDIPVPGDYDGDGRTDVAVYRPSTSVWYLGTATPVSRPWGASGDTPVPGDYDGDGRTDIAVYRPATGVWYVGTPTPLSPSLGASGDVPVPADYDGDGRTDIAVYRPSTGVWSIGTATPVSRPWGASGDIPVPGDYDGDGRADVAVYRPSTSVWYLGTATPVSRPWGASGDIPVPADYDGDGRTDVAVYRPSTSVWYLGTPTPASQPWGTTGDRPLPLPDAIYRSIA